MKYITLIFLAVGLTSATKTTETEPCYYKLYAQGIKKALSFHYSKKDIEKSNEVFKNTIRQVDFPRGIDLEEALIVALKVKDEAFAKELIAQMLKGGIPMTYFQNRKEVTALKNWNEIKVNYPFYQAYHKTNFSVDLRKEVFELRTIDSLFNIKFHQFRKKEIDLEVEELITDVEHLYDKYKSILATYGFPAESKMGYYLKDGKISSYPTGVVWLHLAQLGVNTVKDDFTYEDLVCSGYLPENEYDMLTQLIGTSRSPKGIKNTMEAFYKSFKEKE